MSQPSGRARTDRPSEHAVFAHVRGRVSIGDLQDREPIDRIITFLVVGALLLGVSFFFARRKKVPPTIE